ncbi:MULTISPECIES: EAL domain-containing protein [Vibrio]|uniref:EAL domain-containing protein n=1 Tax=Vibrio TaxID=662 RepID=UPI00207541DE|nr:MULTISPECIES: EAL domain-containing protein [Vibrio]USD33534.1 EAL domain-containing protein [Vibrio sp. SCSIO 43186]USD46602.1 EAL domain-containing protein [Vibrio sp. SCSIO 43145]USD70658.1 EAL domain-containing protein [Vibrio sp. SCSIO 43139]USD95577.1 PAS domain S-box protein [Vibrio coralliilyticus]
MYEVDSGTAVKEMVAPTRQRKYKTYAWQLDLVTQEFSCEPEAMKQLFGCDKLTISAKELLKLLPTAQRRMARTMFKTALTSNKAHSFPCCLLTPNSLFTYVEFIIKAESEFLLKGVVAPCLVISSRMVAADIFYSVFENRHHGVVVTDSETRILACNRHFERITGHRLEDILGLKTNILNAGKLSDDYYRELWQSIEQHGHWSGPMLTRKADDSLLPQELTIHKIEPGNGESYLLGLCADLSNQLQRIDGRETGGVDLLTQLPSRERFLEQLEQDYADSQCEDLLIMLALQPQFPLENEQEIKRQFASYIAENSLVSSASYVGDSRFAVTLKASMKQGSESIRSIRKLIKAFFHSFKHAQAPVAQALRFGLTGVSVLHSDAKSPKRLLSHALQALLELHSDENKRVRFYDRELHEQVERKKRLESWVEQAILEETIDVFYQPIVNIKKGRIDKFEALCRFPESDTASASTQELINVVEDLDLIVRLDDVVNRKAMSALPELQQLFGEDIGLSVNRSFNSKQDIVEILRHCAQLIDESGIKPNMLTIEFTESAYFGGDSYQEQLLAAIRKAGVSIAVDDFGTGCASFDYLNRNYFDVLKIDRSFVQDICFGSRQYHVVNTIIQLAQKLRLKVVAEGVETESEYTTLRNLGVDCIQGYFFSKPLPIKDLRSVSHYCVLPSTQSMSNAKTGTLLELITPQLPHLDPGEPLSLIYTYFKTETINVLPVIESHHCVGIISRAAMNLHLTPNMGTDHETSKEHTMWHKSAHRIMSAPESLLSWHTPLMELEDLMARSPLPWVLVDDESRFKGIVEHERVMQYLLSCKSKP